MNEDLQFAIGVWDSRAENNKHRTEGIYSSDVLEHTKSFLAEHDARLLEWVREKIEDMRPVPPYPNASNNYQKELDEEDQAIDKALSDLASELEK